MGSTIIKAVLTFIFSLSVFGKLSGKTKNVFEQAGYGKGIMYAIALAEAVFTAGLFTQYEQIATIGLLAIMAGAIFTLVRLKEKPAHYILAVITILLLVTLPAIEFSK